MSENKSLIRFLRKLYSALEVGDQVAHLRQENPGMSDEKLEKMGGASLFCQATLSEAILGHIVVVDDPKVDQKLLDEAESMLVTILADLMMRGILFARRYGLEQKIDTEGN
jgi:hypothetical protein